ncbi:MAG TPA: NADH-quinone oxidoreductase subunit M [Thermoleophilaceae bacterium]
MTIHLSIVIFAPLIVALIGAFMPRPATRALAVAGTLIPLGYAVALIADYDHAAGGLQYVTDQNWISELGIRYSLGVDGVNLFLVALTALLWTCATLAAALRAWDRPRLFFFHMALGETAVLGAFLAQDLALFVVFFDLMLVPFFFLIGGWGERRRVQATTRFVIYTLVGSLLMLAAAIALGVLSTPEGGEISFSLAELRQRTLSEGSQDWIFLLFALAFLVKAPAFPLHGWMPDTYRSTPIPVLVLLSGVLSKVGMYGFLRIVLPVTPDAAQEFQTLMLAIAVISILYGSALAFTSDSARLVLGYSSIAQLGFILLGIFALDLEGKGAQGAVFQMVNHGLVVAPGFLIVGALATRAGGSDSLDRMGGMALRAPVLAGLFLIVALASLAMPGSGNFVGELLILFGAFEDQFVWGVLASIGVALAAVYMIRLYIRSVHNPRNPAAESRDFTRGELVAVVPLVLAILALAVYPQLVLERTERSTDRQVSEVALMRCYGMKSFADPDRPRVPIGGDCGEDAP